MVRAAGCLKQQAQPGCKDLCVSSCTVHGVLIDVRAVPLPLDGLQVSLFSAPSLDAPAGPIVAGREADELLATGALHIRGDTAARLLRGERVAAPVVLGSVEGLSSYGGGDSHAGAGGASQLLASLGLGGGQDGSSSAPVFGLSSKEVLLELSLLDASFTLPRDAFGEQPYILVKEEQPCVALHTCATAACTRAHSVCVCACACALVRCSPSSPGAGERGIWPVTTQGHGMHAACAGGTCREPAHGARVSSIRTIRFSARRGHAAYDWHVNAFALQRGLCWATA